MGGEGKAGRGEANWVAGEVLGPSMLSWDVSKDCECTHVTPQPVTQQRHLGPFALAHEAIFQGFLKCDTEKESQLILHQLAHYCRQGGPDTRLLCRDAEEREGHTNVKGKRGRASPSPPCMCGPAAGPGAGR